MDDFKDRFEPKPPSENTSESLDPNLIALYGSIIIGQARIYDVLLMMYSQMNQDGAIKLRKMHEEGKMWYPPPSYLSDDADADDTDSTDES